MYVRIMYSNDTFFVCRYFSASFYRWLLSEVFEWVVSICRIQLRCSIPILLGISGFHQVRIVISHLEILAQPLFHLSSFGLPASSGSCILGEPLAIIVDPLWSDWENREIFTYYIMRGRGKFSRLEYFVTGGTGGGAEVVVVQIRTAKNTTFCASRRCLFR